MRVAAKLGIGLGTMMLIPAGIYGKAYFEGSGTQSLRDATQFISSDDTSKFGYEYSDYFLATRDNLNSHIWKERVKLLKNAGDLKNTEFKNIKDKEDENSLRSACEGKYKENTPNSDSEKDKWKEVWTYCSIGGSKPTTIDEAKKDGENEYHNSRQARAAQESTTQKEKMGKTLKGSVISTYDEGNEWFWKLRDKAFKSGLLTYTNATNHFQPNTTEGIKTICRRAYEIEKTTSTTQGVPGEAEIKRYCSLDKQQVSEAT